MRAPDDVPCQFQRSRELDRPGRRNGKPCVISSPLDGVHAIRMSSSKLRHRISMGCDVALSSLPGVAGDPIWAEVAGTKDMIAQGP